jgi:hypothetical protein
MPSKETVDKALAAIKEPAAYEYFFDQLKSPSWIRPLQERGFFQRPPQGEVEGNYIRFPYWPESRYLARVASLDPELVFETVKKIPQTDNPRVLGDIVDALLAMPPALSERLAKHAGSWVTSKYPLLLPQKLGDLVIHLARGGRLKAALALAHELLAPADIPADEEPSGPKPGLSEPQPRYDMWSYEQEARRIIPILAEVNGQKTWALLADLLEDAVRHTVPEAEPPRDGSGIWRSTVEVSDQNRPVRSMRDVLINLLRDIAYEQTKSQPANLSTIVVGLLERPWRIFHRIAYHLLASQVDANLELARQLALDSSHFDDPDEYHEFWLLVRAVFPRMDQGEQQELLRALATGPTETYGDDPERYRQAWRLRRLAVLKDVLGPVERQEYAALAATLGYEPERPDLLMFTSGMWVGPTSPMEAGQLESMTTQEITAFLRAWQPSEEFMTPSREGLTRNLATAVAAEPRHFAESAGEMTDLHPTYLRGLIDGWASAAKEGRSFQWPPVLNLCRWIVEQKHNSQTTAEETWSTSEWQLARRAITYLLMQAFSPGECEIPVALRNDAWALLEALTRDIDPTPQFEEQYGGSNMDPASLAINTTRGQAMHDVVRYALWVARSISGSKELATIVNFGVMPEVRNVLTERLNVAYEPSAAVRSVYGQWLPWLYSLDANWTKEHLSSIFPRSAELAHLRDAAWYAYLFFSPLTDGVFDLLREQYKDAISRLREPTPESAIRPEAPDVSLGKHIVTQFVRGKLSADDPLIVEFFQNAPLDIRREALAYAGQVVNDLAPNDAAVVERAIELWNSRVAAQTVGGDSEVTAFGWWFIDEEFPANWALEQLSEVLSRTGGKIDHDYAVMIRLAEIADIDPVLAVRCLRAILQKDRERGIILGSADKVSDVLSIALASEQAEARQSAIDLIHLLGAHGYREMRQLLPDPS